MTRAGSLRILIIGSLAIVASCVPLGGALYQAVVGGPLLDVPIALDGQPHAVAGALSAEREARVILAFQVRSESVQEVLEDGEITYQARYRFPISYRINAPSGALLFEQDSTVDWSSGSAAGGVIQRQSSLSESNPRVTSAGGEVSVRAGFRTFDVPADGTIMVSAELGEDSQYGAVAEQIELQLEHDIVDPLFNIILGLFMMVVGWVTAVMGLVFFIAIRNPGQALSSVNGATSTEQRRLAMFCHLAGFAGFLMPLGNVIGPLAMWIANRDSHPYVDDQGREALNFQLSMLVYLLLSLTLVLIVIGVLMLPLLVVFQICMMVIASVRVQDGETFRYPLTIRFIH